MNLLSPLTSRINDADNCTVGAFANSTQPSQATAFGMGLQNRLNLLRRYLTSVVQRIEGLSKGTTAASTTKTLATFAGSTMFVGFRVVTKGTIHLSLNEINT